MEVGHSKRIWRYAKLAVSRNTAMKLSQISRIILWIGLCLFWIGSCAMEPSEPTEPIDPIEQSESPVFLALNSLSESAKSQVNVAIDFALQHGHPGPRVVDIRIRHSKNLELVSNQKGSALIAAGKEMVVQSLSEEQVRVVAFSSGSLTPLGSGRIAELRFRREDAAKAQIEILTDKPIFAPAEVNQGLLVSDPLQISAAR